MSILGMGPLEILVVALIAFIVLGPDRMLEAARFLGRMVGEGRRLASEMPRVVMEDDDIKVVSGGESISMTRDVGQRPSETASNQSQPPESPEEDGPVAFTPSSEAVPHSAEASQSSEGDKKP